MHVKPNHPLTELLAQCLSGIQILPIKEQSRMISRACREAAKWHEGEIAELEKFYEAQDDRLDEDAYDIAESICEHAKKQNTWPIERLIADRIKEFQKKIEQLSAELEKK